jgi:hypothetical protein
MALCITRKAVESEFGVTTFTLVHVKVNRSRFRLRSIRELLTPTQMDFLNPGILQRLDELLWLPSADVKRLRALLCSRS